MLLDEWHEQQQQLLAQASRVFVPSHAAQALYRDSFRLDNAVVTGHPLDADGTAQGVQEIRRLEQGVPSNQRSEDATEFVDIQVSGNRV